ncbi:MAG: MarR family winged helix-turn-helix transcriptional regulator [Beijerinckiaceae bacterium]
MSRLKAGAQRAGHETPDYADTAASDLPLHRMPGHHIRRLQQVAVRLFAEEAGVDLTPVQYAALFAIAQRPGVGQAQLAALIGYDRATIGGVIDRLEQKKWVTRVPSAEDRRVNLLTVTDEGRETLSRAAPLVRRAQERIIEALDEAERAAFERMCLKMLAHHLG